MRSEQEMLQLILGFAEEDERVRAVVMNGSRVNPNATKDIFQDFDIVYVVTETSSFVSSPNWVNIFGERVVMQMPDEMGEEPYDPRGSFVYLMQFADGNRIDLTLLPVEIVSLVYEDSLAKVLLDKDGIIKPLPVASESSYLPKPPSSRELFNCVNEFWWICPYVAKGLWRGEIGYAKFHLETVLRGELMKMIEWQLGIRTDFQINFGKLGKRFELYMSVEEKEKFSNCFAGVEMEENWRALKSMANYFADISLEVAQHFGFEAHGLEGNRVRVFLGQIESLSK